MCSCSGGVKVTRDNLDYYEKLWKSFWRRLRPATAEEKKPAGDISGKKQAD